MKYILAIITTLFLLVSCSDDYFETGIEGQWQMTNMELEDGSLVTIDTIFYSFKKGVFRYTKLFSDTEGTSYMGMYSEKNDSLYVDLREWKNGFSDWGKDVYSRGYKVERRTSRRMSLNYRDTIYHFRIY